MPATTAKNANQNNGSVGDKIFSFILIIALLGGFGYFLVKNEIDSIPKFVDFVKSKSNIVSMCAESEEGIIKCLNTELLSGKDIKPNNNENPLINSTEKIDKLNTIIIAEPNNEEYDRSDYKHWTTLENRCNTREFILKTQGINVITDNDCSPTSGEWIDPYSENVITNASKIDIDHVIPLGYANSHGGHEWDALRKEQFANDINQLLAVSASENRSKSDRGPSEYMPPNKDYHCTYAGLWVDTVHNYQLTITAADRDTLQETLEKC